MKRFFLLPVAVLALLSSFSSCGGKTGPEDVPPSVDPDVPVVSKGAYKSVVIIGVDGAGAFFQNTSTPRLDEIFAGQATTYRSKTSYPTISAQCWASMLHGVLPEFHGITNGISEDKGIQYPVKSPYPSIFRVAREAYPDAKLASFVSWYAINNGIIEHNLGIEMGQTKDIDPEIARMTVQYLSDNAPMLLFVHFGSPDVVGEKEGFNTPAQLKAISDLDTYIGWIYDQLKLKGILDDALFIVTADHGGNGKTHGGNTDAERYVFMGVAGKTVADGSIEDAESQDIAAIAAYALGLECPESWTGHVPAGIFKDVTEVGARKVAELPGAKYRRHATSPTPALSSVQTLLSGHEVTAYFPFDGNIDDAFGKTQTSSSGTLQYYDAYFGKGLALNNGYVTLKDVKVGTGSFSAAFWLKATLPSPKDADPGIISNKDWQEGVNKGFILSLRGSADLKFNVGDGNKARMDFTRPLPTDYNQGWMHIILSVDREK
ncbi:MAG: alkaline phosphatase family protein, partial [Bacteroidales bacterium]|nr:alkaline phosphatase family protein [Bacteroidales bacterium]